MVEVMVKVTVKVRTNDEKVMATTMVKVMAKVMVTVMIKVMVTHTYMGKSKSDENSGAGNHGGNDCKSAGESYGGIHGKALGNQ